MDTILLFIGGGVLGALTGMGCLVVLSLPGIREWPSGYLIYVIWAGTFVGAPLGALGAPLLGWFVLQRVPAGHAVLYAPLGTIVGSLGGLLFGWLFADVADGKGILYVIGGAVIGLVLTAYALRAWHGDRGDGAG